MTVVEFDKFNLNNFYDKTPKPLKYILVISLIIVGSYFLYAKKLDKSDIKQLTKIEESIESTYALINKFDDFRKAQYIFNEQILEYLDDLYTLVDELNQNTNAKLDLILEAGGANAEDILERLELLNETYEKLRAAYTPKEFKGEDTEANTVERSKDNSRDIKREGEIVLIQLDENGNPVDTIERKKYSIGGEKK